MKKTAHIGAVFAVVLLFAPSIESQPRRSPDLDKLEEALKGEDQEAWSAAAKELAALRPRPLDDGWFVAHPTYPGHPKSRDEARGQLEKELRSDDPRRRVEAVEALVGLLSLGLSRHLRYTGTAPGAQLKPAPTPLMLKLASDPEPRVRAGMLWAWRLDDETTAEPLAAKLLSDPDPAVRAQAILALARFGTSDEAISKICAMLGDADRDVRIVALHGVVAFQAERAWEGVVGCLSDKDGAVRHAAAMAAGWLELSPASDRLLQLLDDEAEGIVNWYSMVLPGASGWRTREGVRNARTVAGAAAWAVGQVGDSRAVPWLLKQLAIQREGWWEHDEGAQRFTYPKDWHAPTAAYALGCTGDPRALGPITEAVKRAGLGHEATSAIAALELCPYEPIPYRPLVDSRRVLELRRQPDEICQYPRQFIPHLLNFAGLASEDFLRQVFRPRKDYLPDHPLSLISDFSQVRAGALQCLGRYIDSLELRELLVRLAGERDPAVHWGAIYVLARTGDTRAWALGREVPMEDADARLLAALGLAELADPRAIPLLRQSLPGLDAPWQLLVATALARADDAEGVSKLAELAETRQTAIAQSAAVNGLAQHGGGKAAHVLESWAYRNHWGEAALEGLSRLAREGKISRERLMLAVKARIKDRCVPMVCAEHRLEEFRDELLDRLSRGESEAVPWALAALGPGVKRRTLELVSSEHEAVRRAAATVLGDVGKDDVREPLIALMKDRVPAVRIAAARALGFWAARQADKSAALAALRRAEQDEPNLHVKLEALAARARLGDRSTKRPLEAIVEEGPEWRRFTARAALVALGEKTHLAALHEQLMAELARVNLSHSPRPYEIIRLLGWCGDPASLKLLDRIPVMPCADADPYDGGEQRRSLLAACSLASWRIRREQKTP